MKYKYLELFDEPTMRAYLKSFDKEYETKWKEYDKKVTKREKELNEAASAQKEAEIKAAESKRWQQHADSLNHARIICIMLNEFGFLLACNTL
jgi:hypothetical protein